MSEYYTRSGNMDGDPGIANRSQHTTPPPERRAHVQDHLHQQRSHSKGLHLGPSRNYRSTECILGSNTSMSHSSDEPGVRLRRSDSKVVGTRPEESAHEPELETPPRQEEVILKSFSDPLLLLRAKREQRDTSLSFSDEDAAACECISGPAELGEQQEYPNNASPNVMQLRPEEGSVEMSDKKIRVANTNVQHVSTQKAGICQFTLGATHKDDVSRQVTRKTASQLAAQYGQPARRTKLCRNSSKQLLVISPFMLRVIGLNTPMEAVGRMQASMQHDHLCFLLFANGVLYSSSEDFRHQIIHSRLFLTQVPLPRSTLVAHLPSQVRIADFTNCNLVRLICAGSSLEALEIGQNKLQEVDFYGECGRIDYFNKRVIRQHPQ